MSLQCMQLTPAQLAALQAQGWTVQGGPYPDQATCLVNCGASSSSSSSSSSLSSSSSPAPSSSSVPSAPSAVPGQVTSCCPGRSIPNTLFVVSPSLGTFTVTYDPVASSPSTNQWEWNLKTVFGTCNGGGTNTQVKVRCNNGVWQFSSAGSPNTYNASSGACSPFFSQTFTGVNTSGCGGSASETITVHE